MHELPGRISGLVMAVVSMLIAPTLLMLLVRRFVPVVGADLWRWYWRMLVWLARLPFRVLRVLFGEVRAAGRRRR